MIITDAFSRGSPVTMGQTIKIIDSLWPSDTIWHHLNFQSRNTARNLISKYKPFYCTCCWEIFCTSTDQTLHFQSITMIFFLRNQIREWMCNNRSQIFLGNEYWMIRSCVVDNISTTSCFCESGAQCVRCYQQLGNLESFMLNIYTQG